MKKIIITDKEIIKKILKNKSNCNEMILYIMGKDEKLAIIKTDTMKKRIFIEMDKIKKVIKKLGLHEAILLGELCSEYAYWEKNNKLDNGYFFSSISNPCAWYYSCI